MGQYYTKINTLYKRYGVEESERSHPLKNCIKIGEYSEPETEVLKDLKWECTEKIDGTNMSVHLIPEYKHLYDALGNPLPLVDTTTVIDYKMEIHGKTENANTPKHLQARMEELFNKEKLIEVFTKNGIAPTQTIEVFGEGYGQKIQKGGNYIKDGVDFILFDVKIGKFWLTREACEDIAKKLGVKIVPLVGYMTIPEAEEYVKKGFKSNIAENKDYDAEGLVCKAPCGLLKRNGDRLITKIKTCDYRDLERKLKNMK